ncbi:MAG: penicillin-binding protein 2 [Gemmatimonadota bacterium]|nr:penicillin-binding protein 2 [Gemmatimonadota bacterium]
MSTMQSYRLRDRAAQAIGVLSLAFLILIGAFFRVQALESDRFRSRAEQNRLRPVPLPAPRGQILDRNGLTIAENVPGFAVKLLAGSRDSLRAVLARVSAYVPMDSAAIEGVVQRWAQAPYEPAAVISNATFEAVARLEEHRYSLPGLVIQSEPRRVYPAGKAIGHLIGYVSEVSAAELNRQRFPGAGMGTIVGKDGLELEYDSILRGSNGIRYIEVNARHRMVREEGAAPPIPPIAGEPIHTTLDLSLQLYVDSMWTADVVYNGSLVAVNPLGEILAFYSAPSFDPNEFVGGISQTRWREYQTDPNKPLLNRVLRGRYPPASPYKLATAAMALRRGVVNPDSYMPEPCRGGMQFGSRFFRCWKPEGHGYQNLVGAVATSCDVYFYQLGLRLGVPALLEEGHLLGFGEPTGIDLPHEVSSSLPGSTAWYDRQYGPRGWSNAVALNLAIGQGENDQTLLNMVRFYQGLAGNGTLIAPHLVQPRAGAVPRDLGLTADQLILLRRAMSAVVESGTAAASGGRDIRMAGKTGTAQNPHGEDHGWFIGYAPAEDPKIVVGAFFEFGLHGSTVAPYVARVIRRYLESIDPSLRGVNIRLEVQADSAPAPLTIVPDSGPPVP